MTILYTKQGTKSEISAESLTNFANSLTSAGNSLLVIIIICMNNNSISYELHPKFPLYEELLTAVKQQIQLFSSGLGG